MYAVRGVAMFPDMTLSSVRLESGFVEKVNARRAPLIDARDGGRARRLRCRPAGSPMDHRNQGRRCGLSADGVAPVVLFSRPGMTEIALAFDQNMRAHVAFVQSGLAWLWWYDSQVNQMAFTSFPA